MSRRSLFLLLAIATGAAVVLLAVPDRGDHGVAPLAEHEAAAPDGTPDDRRHTEAAGPVLQGSAGEQGAGSKPATRAPSLFGTVVERASGAGIEGARLVAWPGGRANVFRQTFTDAEGRFGLHNLTPGAWWLFAWHPAYVPAGLEELLDGAKDDAPPGALQIVVPEGVEALPRRTIALASGRRIEGRVVDATGAPVEGARIALKDGAWRKAIERRLHFSIRGYERYLPFRSDAEGRFAAACLPPQLGAVQVGASTPGAVSRWSDPIDLDAQAPVAEIVLELVERASVSGHARLADGTPAAGVTVSVPSSARRRRKAAWAGAGPRMTETDRHGAYALEGLAPGAFALEAEWSELAMEAREVELEPLQPGEARTGVDFTLPRQYVLRGRLQDAAGAPLAWEKLLVRVRVEEDEDEDIEEHTYSTEDGSFETALLHPGPLEILHLRPTGDHIVLREGVVLPADALVLVSEASPRTRIEIRVRDREGAPVPRFWSEVKNVLAWDGPARYRFDSRERGKAGVAAHEILGGPPVRIEVGQAKDAGGDRLPLGSASQRLEALPAGGGVDVVLPYADEVFGRIVGPDGRPVAGVALTLVDTASEEAVQSPVSVQPDGTFSHRVGIAKVYRHRLEVTVPPGYAAVPPRQPPVGARTETIVLVGGGTIAGRVLAPAPLGLDLNGEPLHVLVSWAEPKHGYVKAPVDAEGRWEAVGVPVGVDLVARVGRHSAMTHGYVPPPPIESLRAGATGVAFRLVPGLSIAGRCLEADGTPPPATTLLVVAEPRPRADRRVGGSDVSAVDGAFFIGGLEPGAYAVRVLDVKSRVRHSERMVEAGTTDLLLRLPEEGTIRIRVVGPGGEEDIEFLEAEAWVTGTTTRRAAGSAREPGLIRLDGLPAHETYDLVVYTFDDLVATARGVRTGDEVTVTLVEGLQLSGRLRRANGAQGSWGGSLYAVGAGGCFDLLVYDEEGGATFRALIGMPPGRYELHYVDEDGTTAVLARGVEAGREDLDLVFGD